MKVSELIEFLKTQDQDMQVAYEFCSEQCLLEPSDIKVFVGCKPRPDGWIQNERGDMPKQSYLLFPGD